MTWGEWLFRTCCPARYTAARIDAVLHAYREAHKQPQPSKPPPVQTSAPHAQYVFDLSSP